VTDKTEPVWIEPCVRFINYVGRVFDSLRATYQSTALTSGLPPLIEALSKMAQAAARMAKGEIEDEFSLLRSNSLIDHWGALEATVEDLVIA
jgi:hypothetical protein